MGFPTEIFYRAREIKKKQRQSAENTARQRVAELERVYPEFKELRQTLERTSSELVSIILSNKGDIDKVREENQAAQRGIEAMLSSMSKQQDWLEPQYSCKICSDSGMVDGKVCNCLTDIMKMLAFEELNAKTPLKICSFEGFSLNNYPEEAENAKGLSPRKIMERTLEQCKRYADSFSLSSPSLLMQGGVGLGKTHLSLAIAGKAIEKGYGVLYGSAGDFFERAEKERFDRRIESDTRYLLESCDLLILDDLGAEFSSSYSVSLLLSIVNARLLTVRPTIISTNLSLEGLQNRYTERFTSRLSGSFKRVQFVGKDMRVTLRKARRSGDD